MKECKSCGEEKPLDNYYKHPHRADGRVSDCKECYKEDMNRRKRALKQEAIAYKGGACEHCGGVFHPAVYDFHHLDPAEKDFSMGSKSCSLDKVVDELDKCILLCSNCHRMEHYA